MSAKQKASDADGAANDAIVPVAAEPASDRLPPQLEEGAAVLKAAKLVCGGEDEFCLIRKIGPDWLVAETYADVAPGEPVLVVLGDGLSVAGKTSWVGEARVYVTFEGDVDLDALLARSRVVRGGRQPRMPRVKVDAWARLRVGARVFSVRLRDISQGGAKLQVHGLLVAGEQAVLTVRDLAPIAGVIRWRGECEGGISFNQPLGFAELANWLTSHREPRLDQGADENRASSPALKQGVPALRCVQNA